MIRPRVCPVLMRLRLNVENPPMASAIVNAIKDVFTSPLTGTEWDIIFLAYRAELKAYHKGQISARKLARIVRYS